MAIQIGAARSGGGTGWPRFARHDGNGSESRTDAVSLDSMFLFCSNQKMTDAAICAETPSAAPAATDEAAQDVEMLSCMAGLAQEFARAFQAQGIVALEAGDLDRAGKCEAGFSRLFLGLRRAVALRAKLRRQREEAQHKAEDRRDGRQDEKDDRRHAVAKGLSRAIAVGKPEAKEQLTVELWTRLTEDERIDADLADRALPIEILIQRLGRALGLSRRALGIGLGPDTKAGTDRAGPEASDGGPFVPPAGYVPLFDPDEPPITESASYRALPASDFGGPEGECWL
ncbi:hypothetical protein, partial [Inquilinus sp.]|uniref:hypothetical protein n=1 Tax=Inquilinus sp. TaxID=1932117 RepID=UPI003782FDDF